MALDPLYCRHWNGIRCELVPNFVEMNARGALLQAVTESLIKVAVVLGEDVFLELFYFVITLWHL